PRGRINLVKMVGEGKITDLSVLENPLDLCLGCRACETACPSGVEYGAILESARAALVKRKKYAFPTRVLRNVTFKKVFPSKRVMNIIGDALWLYQKSGLQNVARRTKLLSKFPNYLAEFEAITPEAASPAERRKMPSRVGAKGERKYTVAFFTGCIMDAMFQKVNQLSVQLLAEAGCEVIVTEGQTCCGALHSHSGEMEGARMLAKQNIAAFEQEHVDFIINNAGGCGAMLHEYDHLLATDPKWHDRARAFSDKSKDISQVLIACGGLPNLRNRNERVTYQRSCHLTNVQKVVQEPIKLIKSIPGVELIEMEDVNMCCGSAGIYNIIHSTFAATN
ncbi:(Fe-S)-binding protein, partial [Paenibacillus cremeus]